MSTEQPEATVPVPTRVGPLRILLGLIILAIPIAGLVTWLTIPPGQEASAVLLIEGSIMPPAYTLNPPPLTGEALSQQATIASTAILDDALLAGLIQDPDIRQTEWFRRIPDTTKRVEILRRSLRVHTTPGTGMVTISMRAPNPFDAAKIVNSLARRYMEAVRRAARDTCSAKLEALTQQQSELKRQLKQIRDVRETLTVDLAKSGVASGANVPAEVCRYLAVEQARIDIEVQRLKNARNATSGNALLSSPAPTGPATVPVFVPVTAGASSPAGTTEVEWLSMLQLQLDVREQLVAAKSQLQDTERKLGQCEALATEQARREKSLDRITEDLDTLQLMMRDRDIVAVHVISTAMTEPPFSP